MSKRRVSLDSCSILHLLVKDERWYPHLEVIYNDARAGYTQIVVSEISIAECCKLQPGNGPPVPPATAARIFGQFFRHPFIERRSVTSRESEFASHLILTHGLGTCDAVIAATAAFAEADTLYTTDGCTGRRKAGKLLTISQVVTPCGKQLAISPPDLSKYVKASL